MRTETITRTLYQFDELNDDAKENAREWWRECAAYDDWWEYIYEDAERIGAKIEGFDIDRGSYCTLKVVDTEETAREIMAQHGECCDTYKTAKEYTEQKEKILDAAERDEAGEFVDEYQLDADLDDLDAEFVKALAEDYLTILRSEYEYRMSGENVDENIRCNEYEFTGSGRRS